MGNDPQMEKADMTISYTITCNQCSDGSKFVSCWKCIVGCALSIFSVIAILCVLCYVVRYFCRTSALISKFLHDEAPLVVLCAGCISCVFIVVSLIFTAYIFKVRLEHERYLSKKALERELAYAEKCFELHKSSMVSRRDLKEKIETIVVCLNCFGKAQGVSQPVRR